MTELVSRHQVKRGRLRRHLDDLAAAGTADATVYAPPGRRPEEVPADATVRERLAPLDGLRLPERAREVGAALFLGPEEAHVVVPPFPLETERAAAAYDPGPLRALLEREYTIGVVLLRLEGFSIGVFQGERLLDAKTDTRYVKGKHKAGGQSQRRFERIREKQIQELFDEACGVARTKFGPVERRLDYVFLGGERHTLQAFVKRCRYLQGLQDRMASRVLNAPAPKREALEQTPAEVWKSDLLVFRHA